MTLREFLLQVVMRRTVQGWRGIHTTWREALVVAIWTAIICYVIVLAVWSGVGNHCLWDHLGSRCVNGGGH